MGERSRNGMKRHGRREMIGEGGFREVEGGKRRERMGGGRVHVVNLSLKIIFLAGESMWEIYHMGLREDGGEDL